MHEWMQYSCEIEVVTGYRTESLTKGFESWEVFMLQTIERDSQNKSNNGGLGCQWKKKIGRPGKSIPHRANPCLVCRRGHLEDADVRETLMKGSSVGI